MFRHRIFTAIFLAITGLASAPAQHSFKDSLETTLDTISNERKKLEWLSDNADRISQQVKTNDALKYFDELEKLARKYKDTLKLTQAWRYKINNYIELGKFDEGKKLADSLLSIPEHVYPNCEYVLNLNQAGRPYYHSKDYTKAKEIWLKAIHPPYPDKCPKETAIVYGNLGSVYLKFKEEDKALDYYNKQLEIAKKIKDYIQIVHAYYNIGWTYLNLKNYPLAEKYLLLAMKETKNSNDEDQKYHLHSVLGLLYSRWGKYEKAEKHFFKVLEYFKKKGAEVFVMDTYNNIGVLYMRQNAYEKALQYLDSAIIYAKKTGYTPYLVAILQNKAESLIELNKVDQAVQIIESVIPDTTNLPGISKAHFFQLLYEIHKAKGDYRKALEYYERYHAIYDSILEARNESKFAELERKYRAEQKEKELLRLKTEQQAKELALLKARRRQYLLAGGLGLTLLVSGLLGFLLLKIYRQKKFIEDLVTTWHHQLSNELNPLILSLKKVQKNLGEPDFALRLQNLQAQFTTIQELHKYLYSQGKVSRVNLSDYLKKLAELIQKIYDQKNLDIRIRIPDSLTLPSKQARIVGLFVNEFITNSVKHAFTDRDEGRIWIEMAKSKGELTLRLRDDGPGERGDKQKTSSGYGRGLMETFILQLNGRLKWKGEGGMEAIAVFPEK
ncbi:MAG: tetratricopeptide repeat protein [Chlorobi bacterium]|nr:tetratricopeptide repeat protein [Chlorobiota bacterium]